MRKQKMKSYLFTRQIGKFQYLTMDPETLFWVVNSEPLSQNNLPYPKKLREHLKSSVFNSYHRIRLELVELHLSERCNLNCDYCYVPSNLRKNGKLMHYEQAKEVIEKTIEYSIKTGNKKPRIMFHGGEPLLAKEIIYKLVTNYCDKIDFSIQTNGTLINNEDIKLFEKYNLNVGISIDPGGSSHRNYPPEYNPIENLKVFPAIHKIGILSTITSENVEQVPSFIKQLYEFGVSSVVLNPVSPENTNAKELVPNINSLINNYISAIDTLIILNKKGTNKLVIDNVEGILLPLISDYSPIYCRMSPCGAGRLNLVITENGNVYPCSGFVAMSEFCVGNIFKSDFKSLLNTEICKRLRAREVSKIEECKDCIYRNICGANCPLPLSFLYGTTYHPSFYCEFYKSVIDYLLVKFYESKQNIQYLVSNRYLYYLEKAKSYYKF